MNHLFAARFKMLERCTNTGESNVPAFSNTPGFAIPFSDLKGTVLELQDVMPLLTQRTRGETFAKGELRKKVEKDTLRVALALQTYAIGAGNDTLRKNAHLTASDLQRVGDTVLLSLAGDRLATARNLGDKALEHWNVSLEDLDSLTGSLREFTTNIAKPRERRQQISSIHQTAESLMAKALGIMRDHLDPAALLLDSTQPGFSKAWREARKVNDFGHRTRALTLHLIAAGTNAPVANAGIVLLPGDLHKRSTLSGNAHVQNLAAGKYTAEVSHPAFGRKEVSFDVISGEATVLLIELVPLVAA